MTHVGICNNANIVPFSQLTAFRAAVERTNTSDANDITHHRSKRYGPVHMESHVKKRAFDNRAFFSSAIRVLRGDNPPYRETAIAKRPIITCSSPACSAHRRPSLPDPPAPPWTHRTANLDRVKTSTGTKWVNAEIGTRCVQMGQRRDWDEMRAEVEQVHSPIAPSLEKGPPIFSPTWPMLPSGLNCAWLEARRIVPSLRTTHLLANGAGGGDDRGGLRAVSAVFHVFFWQPCFSTIFCYRRGYVRVSPGRLPEMSR